MKTYFIQAASGPVKIGLTRNGVQRRANMLSTGSHEAFRVLGYIEGDREPELHSLFRTDRIRGEWFRPTEALLAFVSEHVLPLSDEDSAPDTTYVRLGQRRPALERVKKAEKRPSLSNVIEILLDEALDRRRDEGRAA